VLSLYASRPQQIAAGITGALLLSAGFAPLFGGPGYEHALATGLIAPSAAAIAVAVEVSVEDLPPIACLGRGVASGLAMAAVAFATAILHGLRLGFCDFRSASVMFALTAGIGAVMGGVWGAIVAEVARGKKRRRLWAVLAALAGPVGAIAISLARYYTTPMIFAFDPFVGYFSGTLYDTVIDPGEALLTYRAGSLATLGAIALLTSALHRTKDASRLRFVPLPDVSGRLALSALLAAASLGITLSGHALGHWQSSASIAAELGAARSGARCTVYYPSSERAEQADLLLRDCEEELASVERFLGARGPDRVSAFFFADAAEKKKLMGAADTYIAKPWRAEVYLQLAGYPHPVLGHELAHVVAGSFARGPFKVAGEVGGVWPNPGLIEGIAVAASPDDDDLTDAQWARAMLELEMLPPVKRVFSLAFLGEQAAKSYTIAGAFVRWAIERFGAGAVRLWYGGESVEKVTGEDWGALDRDFRGFLRAKYTLSPDALAFARARFGRPSVFGRVCPHVVDELRREADRCRDASQYDKAVTLYSEVLARDAHDFAARYSRAYVKLRYGDGASGRAELAELAAEESAPRNWRDKSAEALADADFLDGRFDAAAEQYRALAARSLDEDGARTLEVKALGAERPAARAAVEALLIGSRYRAPDLVLAAVELGAWSRASGEPLADYLIGKNLAQRGWYVLAAIYLDRVLSADGAPTPRIGREALRQRAVCACASGDASAMERVKAAAGAAEGPFAGGSGGRREALERMIARCGRGAGSAVK
jgi:hypothetical protein